MDMLSFKYLAAIFALSVAVFAAPVSFEKASKVAENTAKSKKLNLKHKSFKKHGAKAVFAPAPDAASAATVAEDALFYVFQNDEDKGFVIIAGNDVFSPIIGISDKGIYDPANLPPNFAWYIENIEREMEFALENGQAQTQDIENEWELHAAGGAYVIGGYLVKTKWNQTAPYWNKTPTVGTRQTYTGCVATTMAQIMNYHQYPESTTSIIPAYTSRGGLSVSALPPVTFDWDNMADTYRNNTAVQNDAVATLMNAAGRSAKMDYGTESSGAYSRDAAAALLQYFDYDNSLRYVYSLSSSSISTSDWKDLIIGQIENNSPVFYEGQGGSGGHAFIIDGYDDAGKFHLNWGWSGSYDGFFALTALSPGSYQFNDRQGMIINIMPNKNGNPPSQIKVSRFEVSTTETTVSADIRAKMNYGADFSGKIGFAVMMDDTVNMVLDSAAYSISNTYSQSSGRYTVNYKDAKLGRQLGEDMPSGILTLQVVTKRSTGEWTPVGETRLILYHRSEKVTAPTVTATNLVYNGQEQSAGIAADDLYTVIGDVATDAGNYEATIALKDKDNYEWLDGTTDDLNLPWSISKAVGVGMVAIDGWTYGDEPNAPVSNNEPEAVSYGYKVQDTDDETYRATVPANAGNYTVCATFEESDNYLAHSDTADFEIIAKPVTITGITAASKEYNGDATATITGTATVNGAIDGDDVTVINGIASFADKNAGTGKLVTFSGFSLGGNDAGNYVLSEQPASVTADIIKVSPILPQIADSRLMTPARNGINLAAKTNVTIEVYNLSGKLISKQSYLAGNHSISLGHLPKGIYLVRAQKAETLRLTIL